MNLYPLPANKVALRLLNGLEYTRGTIEFLTYCCDFHGCGNYNFHKNCVALFKAGGIPLILLLPLVVLRLRVVLFLEIREVEDRGQAQEVDGDVAYPS